MEVEGLEWVGPQEVEWEVVRECDLGRRDGTTERDIVVFGTV
jgi:hypothetical protein